MKTSSSTAKALRYEGYRFCHTHKFWLSILIIFFLLLLVSSLMYFFVMEYSSEDEPVLKEERAEVLQENKEELRELYEMLEFEPYMKQAILPRIKELEFLTETNTVREDYVELSFLQYKEKGREKTEFMIFFEIISTFLFLGICIFSTTFFFTKDYSTNNYKNIFVGTTGKGAVFKAKMLLHSVLTTFIFFLLFVFGFSFGARNPLMVLLKNGQEYFAISTTELYFSNLVNMMIMGIAIISLSLLIGIFSKKPVYSVIFPMLFIIIMILVDFTHLDILYVNTIFVKTKLGFLRYFPIISLHYHCSGFDLAFLIKALVHVLFSGVALILSYRKFQKTI